MLFASDLDQTLIYSYRTQMSQGMIDHIRPVEWLNDRFISYMTQSALSKLKEICQSILFVPVTTRTKVQYQRINFLGYEIAHQYAVTSNGGTIFCRGIEDREWSRQVLEGRTQCAAAQDLIQKFEEIADPMWVIKDSGKLADNLFYYCLIEREQVPVSELAAFKIWASEHNWELSVQGRKLYLVPINVNKKLAIQYIKEKEGISRVIAAGDSLLDLEMLKAAELGLVPSHGELYTHLLQGDSGLGGLRFTTKTGIEAAEEILEVVAESLIQKTVI
ncbi:HAD hydrolase family protein [Desulfosporosinus sp. Sb-LF]|uniref:HAD family hydrolase n=1 Tax=Desulfosporosinus sp. Sb-LF TaxID=2560027 RepID=UPI001FB1217F|nr:HAD hydrolase family protein [Desulfosporosinus sp. Sb-LF]